MFFRILFQFNRSVGLFLLFFAASTLIFAASNEAPVAPSQVSQLATPASASAAASVSASHAQVIRPNAERFDPLRKEVFFNILVMDKAKSQLTHYELRHGQLALVKAYPAISGKRLGDKASQGDFRTPEGIYFFDHEMNPRQLSLKHGQAAITLNYPNPMDVNHEKTGYGIWLHGVETDDRIKKRFDTEGCIAMKNADVKELIKQIHKQITPILVFNDLSTFSSAAVPEIIDFEGIKFLEQWADAWQNEDMETYATLYDRTFKAGFKSYAAWQKYKMKLAKRYTKITVQLKYPVILRHNKYSVALFYQNYKSNMLVSRGLKRLYLKPAANDPLKSYKIINEEFVKGVADLYLPFHDLMVAAVGG